MSSNIRAWQDEHYSWVTRNFPRNDEEQAFLGIVEEVGELAHARLKFKQQIRGHADGDFAKYTMDIEDSLGDLFIYMLSYANAAQLDLDDIIRRTWEEVKSRDWILYPDTGRPPVSDSHASS